MRRTAVGSVSTVPERCALATAHSRPAEAEREQVQLWRRMSSVEKLRTVTEITEAALQLSLAIGRSGLSARVSISPIIPRT